MKNVLVTGCLGGIGRSTTLKLLENGYNVFGIDVKPTSDIPNLHYYQVDIRNEDNIKEIFSLINNEIDELYAIIHLSGIYLMDSLLEISSERLEKIFDINFKGVVYINKIFFPLLKKGSRVLITTSEVATLDPLPFNGIYSITKATLEKYAYSLRMELNLFGIYVTVLRPGAIKTNLLNDSTSSLDEFVSRTIVHKNSSKRFKKIVDSVESKSIEPAVLAKTISKIISKKKPKYAYSKNANALLKLLNFLPHHLQVFIITQILK